MSRRRDLFGAISAGALLVGALAGGCAFARTQPGVGDSELTRALRQSGVPAETAAPFAITPEMRAWVHAHLPAAASAETQLHGLLQALLERDGVPFRYVAGVTTGAAAAWTSGAANCLTFSHVFVALTREAGLDTYYLRVHDLAGFEKEGDLVVASDHVTAAWGPSSYRLVLDFTDRPIGAYRQVEPISDRTALALHYSNLGAERIRAGDAVAARRELELAVRIDPELTDAWVNLGVARRRNGDSGGAERAYRRALEIDPETVSAYHNLAALLELHGRGEEAQSLLGLASRAGSRDPWSYLALGDVALRHSRLVEAERFYRRAVRLDGANAEAWAALGEWALASGKPRQARSFLARAERLEAANARVRALAARMRART